MDNLPASLLYYTQTLSNFTRNTVKLNTLNQTRLASNGATQLRLALPVNAVANLKSLSLVCTVATTGFPASTGEDDAVFALIPRNGPSALIDRLTFSSGGISLDNSSTPYHVVHAIKQNLKKGTQKYMSDDKVLSQSIIEPIDLTSNRAINNYGQEKSFIVNNFCGFTEGQTYLDLNLVPEIFLTMQIGDKSLIPVQYKHSELGERTPSVGSKNPNFTGTQCEFEMKDIYFTLEVIQIGSGLYSAMTQRLMQERGSIDVCYPQYQMFSQEQSSSGGTVRGSVSCMSLDKIYGFQRNTSTATDAGGAAPYDPYWMQQPPIPVKGSTSYGFNNAADNFISEGIASWQTQINNSPMPTFKASRLEAFNFAVNADDRSYSDSRGGLVSSQEMWMDNCWCAVQRLCFDENRNLISGLNLSSINSTINFTSYADGVPENSWTRQGMLMTEQTSLLRIGASRAIACVA